MKINIIFRKFSGLQNSFEKKKDWEPIGSPVLINFIKYLDKRDDLQIILVDENKNKTNYLCRKFSFKNLKSTIFIVNKNFFNNQSIFFKILNNLILLSFIIFKSLFFRPNAHYIDNQNLVSGAILSLISNKVTLRLLGAWGINYEFRNQGFFSFLRKKFYGFKFKNIICTDDGSNFINILDKNIFSKRTNIHHILNGSQFLKYRCFSINKNYIKNKFRVIHFGRFDIDKGTHKFISTVHKIIKLNKNIEFLIFGYGNYFNDINQYVKKHNIQRFVKILHKQNFKQIEQHMLRSDLYVSTNIIGSLSNSSLEVIGYGLPCIFVNTNEDKNHYLKKKLKKNYFYFFEKKFEESLCNLILKYYNNPQLLKLNSIEIKSKFENKILNWENRIEIERNLLLY